MRSVKGVVLTCTLVGLWFRSGDALYRAFSCDTGNITLNGNVFSAVQFKPTGRSIHRGCPTGASADADPLGPCFAKPADIKVMLDALPSGARALTLEGSSSMYYLQDENATAVHWGGIGSGENVMYYMDTLPGPANVQGPWADVYAQAIQARFDKWFEKLKATGAEVDLVLGDFEMGDHSASFNWAHQPTADGSNPTEALLADPRWPALRDALNDAGKSYGVVFDDTTVRGMAGWHTKDWHMHVWSEVVSTQYVARLLNTSVFAPIQKHFPDVRFSNFAHAHHTDPSGRVEPSSVGRLWAGRAAIGLGAHVGTHQSKGFYGGTNATRVIASQTPGPNGRIYSRAGTSFDALVQEIAVARDMVRAAPQVPVHPWLAPKYADWGKGYSYLSSGNVSTDEVMMWEEHVFHQALSTGTTEFLWWQPGAERPTGLGLPLLSSALAELDAVTGVDDSGLGAGQSCTMLPFETNLTRVDDFALPYLMSSMAVECTGKPRREVYRFTPRCTKTIWCTWWDSSQPNKHYPPANGTVAPSWRIGSGFNLQTPEGTMVWLPESPVSTAGAWLVRDVNGARDQL